MSSNKSIYSLVVFFISASFALLFIVRSSIETIILPPTVQLPDGGQYYGSLKDSLFSGEGKILWPNGGSYHGQFKDGLFHGVGRRVNAVGDAFEGQFIGGVFTGQGQITTVDGSIYKGQVENYQFNGHGRLDFAEKSYYVGQFKDGLYHGYGTLVIADVESYNGYFEKGRYQGEGDIHYADGDSYKGSFKKNKRHGKGIYTTRKKHVYDGFFVEGKLTGQGVYIEPGGSRYDGGFREWLYEGKGIFNSIKGDQYEGDFLAGNFTGTGVFKSKDGRLYQGEFKDWLFDGEGVLLAANGDRYEGSFSYGKYDGNGILTYAAPVKGKPKLTGNWSYGRYIGDGSQPDPRESNAEKALYLQQQLLDDMFEKLLETDENRINLYFIGIGGDGKQDVFYKEVNYIQNLFDQTFDTLGRSAILVNNSETVETIPLATVTSVEKALNNVAAKMDAEKDILFLYLTSHGSKKHDLSIDQQGISLPDLSAKRLAGMLKALPVRWKVVVISACFSGGFIPLLEDEYTMVISASAYNRASFGCSDEAEMTYFGRAYFKESLTGASSFESAFVKAKELIYQWEEKQNTEKSNKHSDPQISSPRRIRHYLKKWFIQLQKDKVDKSG